MKKSPQVPGRAYLIRSGSVIRTLLREPFAKEFIFVVIGDVVGRLSR
jgi:dihydrofolate reductase